MTQEPRKILIGIDDSACSLSAARWTVNSIVQSQDEVHLVAVNSLISTGIQPSAPLATAGGVAALAASYQQALKNEEHRINMLLYNTKKSLLGRQSSTVSHESKLHLHALPPAGGASGVAESICIWARKHRPDLLILGSRGMGTAKSTLYSILGLGSVSDYCVHHLEDTPICIYHQSHTRDEEEFLNKKQKKVLVCVDDSEIAQHAQEWAVDQVVREGDELHLVTVALPVPYVAGVQLVSLSNNPIVDPGDFEAEYRGALQHAEEITLASVRHVLTTQKIAVDDVAAAHVLEQEELEASIKNSSKYAKEVVDAAKERAYAMKIPKERIFFKSLEPEGGASEVAKSIKHYVQANSIDVVIMGSRGIGAIKRAILSFIGLGSVSSWCVHNVDVPVIIVPKKIGNGKDVHERQVQEQ